MVKKYRTLFNGTKQMALLCYTVLVMLGLNLFFTDDDTTPWYAAFRLVKSLDSKRTVKLDRAICNLKKVCCLLTILHKPC
jgi:hypothetical protein